MKHPVAVFPYDHERRQITGGAEIKTCIDACTDRDIRLTRAAAPCALIHEPGLGGNALVEDQIAEGVFACGHALRLLG
jgi:hypothetical protein